MASSSISNEKKNTESENINRDHFYKKETKTNDIACAEVVVDNINIPPYNEPTKVSVSIIKETPIEELVPVENELSSIAVNNNSTIIAGDGISTIIVDDDNSTSIAHHEKTSTSIVNDNNFITAENPNQEKTIGDNSAMPMSSNIMEVIQNIVKKEMDNAVQCIKNHTDQQFKQLGTIVTNIGKDLDQVKVLLTERRPLMEQENIMSYHTFKETYSQYKFPLQSIAEFTDFNNDIKENSDLKQDLKKVLYSNINTENSIKVNLTTILKNFASGALITQHTAQKEVQKKPVLSSTMLFKCIEGAILECYKEAFKLQNKVFNADANLVPKALGAVINCAADWDGKRQKRTKRSRRDSHADDLEE
ncbi:uncharacterized protein LOC107981236 [Nasonia vitripennis]|uniref:Uncharacterized protein n=1 Tax=Nasonia vitripennis TaxID=7425 RepID=A0A7M7IZ73_NASVI|nr:uncharacterized protein LOC107981236 [Nasonia vitripennis]